MRRSETNHSHMKASLLARHTIHVEETGPNVWRFRVYRRWPEAGKGRISSGIVTWGTARSAVTAAAEAQRIIEEDKQHIDKVYEEQ